MANQTINTEINVNLGNSAQTVGELRQEYKELLKDINNTAQGTEEYNLKLKQLGAVRADIQDLKDDMRSLDPGEKLTAIGSVAQGLVGGFTAATGAVAMFAGENEDLQKTLVKVNSSIALLGGVQSVMRAFDDGKRILAAFSAGTTAATSSVGKLWAIMRANPIGLILTAVTAIIGAFSLFSSSSDDAAQAQDRLTVSVENYNKALARTQSVTESEIALRRKQAELNGASANELQKIDQDLLKSKVETSKKMLDAVAQERAEVKKRYVEMIEEGKSEKKLREFEQKELADAVRKELDAQAAYNIAQNNLAGQAIDYQIAANKKAESERNTNAAKTSAARAKAIADAKRAADEEKKIRDDFAKFIVGQDREGLNANENALIQLEELFAKLPKPTPEQIAEYERVWGIIRGRINADDLKAIEENNKKAIEAQLKADEEAKRKREEAYKLTQEKNQDRETQDIINLNNRRAEGLINEYEYVNQLEAINLESLERQKQAALEAGESTLEFEMGISEAKIQLMQKEAAARKATLQTVSNALGAFADLAGEQTVAGKALAVAQTTIDTYMSATAAFKSMASIPVVGPALGVVAAAAAVASGISNVRKIVSVKVPGKSDKGSPALSGGGSNYTAPTVASGALQTQFNDTSLNAILDAQNETRSPIRAYVVERDITSAQERVEGYRSASSLGG